MNSTLFGIVGIAIIAFLIHAFIKVFDKSLWSLLVLVLVIGGLAIEYFYRSNIGTVLALLGIVILIIVYVHVIIQKSNYTSGADRSYASSSGASSRRGFSNNIYTAIEEFGRLTYQCKQATQWPYDERDHGMITVTNGPNGAKLEISCCGDCIACTLPSEFGWLRNEDNLNEIKYVAENVTGYVRETYGSVPSEADSLFYFFKKGNPHAIGRAVWTEQDGDVVNMSFKLQ